MTFFVFPYVSIRGRAEAICTESIARGKIKVKKKLQRNVIENKDKKVKIMLK